jgi:serine O-acetyltransferase
VKHLADSLLKSYAELKDSIPVEPGYLPSRSEVVKLIDKLRCLLFPGYFSDTITSELLEEARYLLNRQLLRLLKEDPAKITKDFLAKLPKIRASLATDVEAAFDGDPAAADREEIIISYPGIYAISIYRLAHELYLFAIPMLPRILTEHAHSVTGIDIHPGAKIDNYFFIDHGTGIVVGETTIIGKRVKIYQGVTLGALSTRGGQSLRGQKRHPTVEDNVTIYSGASVFGGNTVIGKGTVLGSNVFVTDSVPPGSKLSINDIPWKKEKATENDVWFFEI